MRHIDLERKQTSRWPWVAGVAIFALAAWGATSLLAPADDEEETPAVVTAEDTLAPAAIPAPPAPVRDMSAGRSIEDLSPLTVEHVGEAVRADGEVVATGTSGFWMVAAAQVIRVDSERTVRTGEAVVVHGTLQPASGEERTEQIASEVLTRSAQADSWDVVLAVKLVEGMEADGAQP